MHILTFLATLEGQPASSDLIASSVGTNPALIRRLLAALTKAGLTKSQMGAGGGAYLARPPETITLKDIFDTTQSLNALIPLHSGPNPACPVGRNISAVLSDETEAARDALVARLAKTSIADLAGRIGQANSA